MRFSSKFIGLAAAGAMFALSGLAITTAPASANTCTLGSCSVTGLDGQLLDGANSVFFDIDSIDNDAGAGTFRFEANFNNQSPVPANVFTTVLQFGQGVLGSIKNLVLTFNNPAAGSFQITDGNGDGVNLNGDNIRVFQVDLTGSPGVVDFELTGMAVMGPAGNDPSINLLISTVPIPAALPLFGSALLGLGLLGRRRTAKQTA